LINFYLVVFDFNQPTFLRSGELLLLHVTRFWCRVVSNSAETLLAEADLWDLVHNRQLITW
jgi:hypothetical protein